MDTDIPVPSTSYVPPVPRELRTPTPARRAARVAQALAVAGRHMGPLAARKALRREVDPAMVGRALRLTFTELGGTYVKLGQLVGSAPGVFGAEMAEELRSCLDQGPPIPFARVRASVESSLAMPLEGVYRRFDPDPIAAASIAVVHRAELIDGTPVAVKVLRPGITALVAADLDSMRPLFGMMARQGLLAAVPLIQLLFGFREQLAEELDLRNEARAMTHFRQLFADVGLDAIVVPHVHHDQTARSVLTMEFLDGRPIDDPAHLETLGVEPGPLIEQMVRAWMLTAIRDGVFHADVHAGNLLALRDGRLGLIDWGIVGRLDPETHRFFCAVIRGAMGDESAWMTIGEDLAARMSALGEGGGPSLTAEELAKVARAQMQPILTQPFGQVGLSTLFMSRDQLSQVIGRELPGREQRSRRGHLLRRRRVARAALDDGVLDSEWFRSNFLLVKQLLYVERYGTMYLQDAAILQDTEFLTKILGDQKPGEEDRVL